MSTGSERVLSLCRTAAERRNARIQLLLCARSRPWRTDARIPPGTVLHHDRHPLAARAVCCFAHHDPLPRVDETVFLYLRAITNAGYAVVFVSTAPRLPDTEAARLAACCARVVSRPNTGLDFASWKCALESFPDLRSASSLFLANDSACLVGDLGAVFTCMDSVPCDFWGMTESAERRRHLQSYFLVFRERALRSDAFLNFWANVSALPDKKLVIRRYETALTLKLALAGLQGAAYAPAHWFPDRGKRNPSILHGIWAVRTLGVPLLKRQLLTENPFGADAASWPDGVTPVVHAAVQAHRCQLSESATPPAAEESAAPSVSGPLPRPRLRNPRPHGSVDILLPTYNGREFLPVLLESILKQRDVSLHILARDDGSTDDTLDILDTFARRTGLVNLASSERRGVNENIFTLLQHSYAPYFAFADQDDIWYPHKISTCLAAMAELEQCHGKETPLLVHSDARVVDRRGFEKTPSFKSLLGLKPGRTVSFAQALVHAHAQGCTMLGNAALRRQIPALPEHDALFMYDWWIHLIALVHGAAYCLDRPLLDYRQHSGNALGALARHRSLRDTLCAMRGTIRKTRKQAASLLALHGPSMNQDMYEICHAWSTMGTRGFWTRKHLCARFGFTKPGSRKIPFFFLS